MKFGVFLLLTLVLVFSAPFVALACSCGDRPVCVDYSIAKSVFLGKLIKSEKAVVENRSVNIAQFAVARTFKGTPNKVQTVTFGDGECDPEMKTGKVYLVFQDKTEVPMPCNRSGIAAEMPFVMNYVESVDPNNPKFLVAGSFEGVPEEDLVQIEVIVSFDGGKASVRVDRNGQYGIEVRALGKLRVEAKFPYPTDMFYGPEFAELTDSSAVYPGSTPTLLTYNLEYKPNECSFRQFGIKRQKTTPKEPILSLLPTIGNEVEVMFGVRFGLFRRV